MFSIYARAKGSTTMTTNVMKQKQLNEQKEGIKYSKKKKRRDKENHF